MRHDLHEGGTVTLAGDVDLYPYATLKGGELATVTEITRDEDGYVFAIEVLMHREHRGLDLWRNHAIIGRTDLDHVEPTSTPQRSAA